MKSAEAKPTLVVFTSNREGASRKGVAFLAQVLQRRQNQRTFDIRYVAREERPDLLERFRVEQTPTFVVIETQRVRARLARPRSCADIEQFLRPWLKNR